MKIQFEIKEKMHEIISEILNSEEWKAVVEVDQYKLKKVVMRDLTSGTKLFVEIWEKEIHIKTPKADQTYRIFKQGNTYVCEYIGQPDGILRQSPFPTITPVVNIKDLDEEKSAEDTGNRKASHTKHGFQGGKVNDDYIKDGMPMPRRQI
jgi:hypothetical protein